MPALFVALKADMDKSTQRGDLQPEEYTTSLGLQKPLHVSVTWGSIGEVFVQIAEAALWPGSAMPSVGSGEGEEGVDWVRWGAVGGAVVVVGAAVVGIWRRVRGGRE